MKSLKAIAHLILPTLGGRRYHSRIVWGEETGSESLSELTKIISKKRDLKKFFKFLLKYNTDTGKITNPKCYKTETDS